MGFRGLYSTKYNDNWQRRLDFIRWCQWVKITQNSQLLGLRMKPFSSLWIKDPKLSEFIRSDAFFGFYWFQSQKAITGEAVHVARHRIPSIISSYASIFIEKYIFLLTSRWSSRFKSGSKFLCVHLHYGGGKTFQLNKMNGQKLVKIFQPIIDQQLLS